jgi:putative ABC transport system permease protein
MLRFAYANLLSRPGRTVLATLGLTIAIANMVGLFAIAGGIDALLESSLGRIPGVIILQPGAPVPLFSVLPAEWGAEMADIEGVGVVNPEVWARVNLLDGVPVFSPPRFLMGTDPRNRARLRHGVYDQCLEAGRFLDERDAGQPHIVVSRQIAEDVGKTVGDRVEVNGRSMTIIGIYHCGSLLLDVNIIGDISVVRELARIDARTVNNFYLEPQDGVPTDVVVERVQRAFAGRELPVWQPSGLVSALSAPPQTLCDGVLTIASVFAAFLASVSGDGFGDGSGGDTEPNDSGRAHNPVSLQVRSVAEWGEEFDEMTADLDLILALLTALGIAIAISSILNTMLMSVTERTTEFGVLRANGWSQGDVVRLITYESALLGLAGGLFGVLCGWTATLVINSIWSDRVHLYAGPGLLVSSLVFSVCVGMLGGLYPAVRAARMSPMDAIRRG